MPGFLNAFLQMQKTFQQVYPAGMAFF